ncbi:cell division protein ZapA [Deltaproteobacteria bacterium PRO3]|nr:cell division protein ZapA [Deltaproteobacteria bacterium PRO3]
MKKTFEVVLLNQKFQLKSESDEKYVQRVADYVNKKLFDIQEKTKSVSSLNVALLAALNIADDFFRIKTTDKGKVGEARAKVREILGLIDRQLGH